MSKIAKNQNKLIEEPWSPQTNQRKRGNMESKVGDVSQYKNKPDSAENDCASRSKGEVAIRKVESQCT